MKTIDLAALTQDIETFIQERDWDKFHSVKNLSTALTVEASELAEIFQWMTEKDSNEAHLDPALKVRLEDEVADVFVYLLRIMSKSNIDLESSVRNKMRKNAEKYPVELSKGNSKKYDQF